MTIPEWVATAVFVVLTTVLGWGFRRMLDGQDSLHEKVGEVAESVTRICGHIDTNKQNIQGNKDVCDEREENNSREHERIDRVLEKLRV